MQFCRFDEQIEIVHLGIVTGTNTWVNLTNYTQKPVSPSPLPGSTN